MPSPCRLRVVGVCKSQKAREHFTTAMTMYRDMDMTYWLEKAKAELPVLS